MAVASLPHFTLLPNWRDRGVSERLEWLTSVLGSPSGAEQRFALRLTPRRSFEALFTAAGAERTLLDLAVGKTGAGDWWLPLWHDVGRLTADAASGAGSLLLDTTNREFAAGGFAMLHGGAFSSEVVEIASVASGSLTLAGATAAAWPAGTRVFPAVRAALAEQPRFTKKGGRAFEGVIRFEVSGANPWTAATLSADYLGYPVLADRPDEAEDITHAYSRLVAELDGQTGLKARVDTAGLGFTAQQYRWFLHDRAQHAAFRSLLYALQGRLVPVWLPTFTDDLTLAAPASSGATTIEVALCGYARFGGPRVGRRDIRIELDNGVVMHRRVSAAAEGATTETLTLASGISQDISPETVRRISFMSLSRLDQDAVEIVHHTDTRGVSTATATFKSTPESRVADAWAPPALLQTVQTPWECGQEPVCELTLSGSALEVDSNEVGFDGVWCLTPIPESLGGGLWVAYTDFAPVTAFYRLRIARISSAGALVAGPVTVHTGDGDPDTRPRLTHRSLAVLESGNVVVAWAFDDFTGRFAIYNEDGVLQEVLQPMPVTVIDSTHGVYEPMVVGREGGGFVFAYQGSSSRVIKTEFFDANGLLDLGGSTVADRLGGPSEDRTFLMDLSRASAGNFVVAWTEENSATDEQSVVFCVYQDDGSAVTSAETVETWTYAGYEPYGASARLYPRTSNTGFRLVHGFAAFDIDGVLPPVADFAIHTYNGDGAEQGSAIPAASGASGGWVGGTSPIAWLVENSGQDVTRYEADGTEDGSVRPTGTNDDYFVAMTTVLDEGNGDQDRAVMIYIDYDFDPTYTERLYVQFIDPCGGG